MTGEPAQPDQPREDFERPFAWLLTGARAGDNNQLLTLAEALGYPFEEKHLYFNALRYVPLLRSGLTIVATRSRASIRPPWPDLVLCVGYGSVPVARFIRSQTGGRAKLVHIGNPRARLNDFDLQITNPQYARTAPNLLELPFPIGNPAKNVEADPDELAWLESFARPRRLIAVGGPARNWQLDHAALANAIETLRSRENGSLIVATSPRTTRSTRDFLRGIVNRPGEALVHDFPRFSVLLALCDEFHVTADSVSMLSEAVLTGKPVGMISIAHSTRGKLSHWFREVALNRRTLPDFPNFWQLLYRHELVGSVENPVSSRTGDTVGRAASVVRKLMDGGRLDQQEG